MLCVEEGGGQAVRYWDCIGHCQLHHPPNDDRDDDHLDDGGDLDYDDNDDDYLHLTLKPEQNCWNILTQLFEWPLREQEFIKRWLRDD